jgi:uncharacterized membrane protein HdeD (DUF308 family)
LCLGIDSTQEILPGKDKVVSLLGSGIGILLLLGGAMLFVDAFKKRAWQRIGVRIIGSWLAASAFLALTLSLYSRP